MSERVGPPPDEGVSRGTAVVLVHGAWHDGSCWAPVVAASALAGRDVRVVDLPADLPAAGAAACVDAVLDVVGDHPRVLLVGHSLGGLTVPVVAQRLGPRRVAALVLVAALVPRPGTAWQERARSEEAMAPGFGRGQRRHDDGTTSWPPGAAGTGLYAGVAEESSISAVATAVAGLRRQDWTITREVTPLTAWPAVRTIQVICSEDRVVDPGWSRSSGAVPGAELVEVEGGHFPMLTRPDELARIIATATAA